MEFALLIIVGVIVAVISAAAKKKPSSSGEQGQTPRPVMSDIQRAFMMAAGLQDDAPSPPPVRPVAPPMQYYAPPAEQAMPYAASAAPVVAEPYTRLTDNMDARSMAVESVNPFTGIQVSAYFMDDEADALPQTSLARQQQLQSSAGMRLFEDQNDLVKAVIYSEILPRRSGAQRR